MKVTRLRLVLGLILAFVALSILGGSAFWVALGFTDMRIVEGRAAPVREGPFAVGDSWRAYGGDPGGHRYASVAQITPDNVKDLEPAWTYRTGALEGRSAAIVDDTAFPATPLHVEDSLIFCTPFNEVIALNPGTGAEKWRYDPKVPTDGRPANQFQCRGVSYWRSSDASETGLCTSRIFTATVDARLVAVDARSGAPCTAFGDNGAVKVEPTKDLIWPGEMQITSAPAIIGDVIVTGTSLSDNARVDAPVGVVHAYDVRTGAPLWTFNPIPWIDTPDGPRAGHANVWSTMSVDEDRGLVFLPTSTASPDFFGGARPGDNANADSVVALRAATGEIAWARQIVHHDVWDYDMPAQPGLYQILRDGERHDVVVQLTKMGLIFVLDRDTGDPFHPIEERPTPQGGVAGEVLSATQPFPVRPAPVVPNTVDPDQAFGVTLWDKLACRSALNALRREGLYTPPSVEGALLYPFTGGGANWGGGAYDPARNLLVVNMNSVGQALILHPKTDGEADFSGLDADTWRMSMDGAPYAVSLGFVDSPLRLPCTPPPWGVLAGVDLERGEIVWRRPFGTTRDLAPLGIALDFGTPSFGGPIVTAGGVGFIGAAMDHYLRAFDVETGAELWKGRLPAGGQATPMTYDHKGRQYVVIAAGGHAKSGTDRGDYVLAFALGE